MSDSPTFGYKSPKSDFPTDRSRKAGWGTADDEANTGRTDYACVRKPAPLSVRSNATTLGTDAQNHLA